MTFWRTVGAVIVGNIIVTVLTILLMMTVFAGAFFANAGARAEIEPPENIEATAY